MQKWIGIGGLVRDPEMSTTSNGTTICKFSLAVKRDIRNANGEYETDFFNVVVFGKLGENCGKYLKKGSKCCVIGRLQNDNYEKDGVKHYTTSIVANEVEFLSSPAGQTKPNTKEPVEINAGETAVQIGLSPIDLNDLPF